MRYLISQCDSQETQETIKRDLVQSVVRAGRVLDRLADAAEGKGLAEISREVNLHIATTRRLLATLANLELVQLDKETKKYSLGLKLFLMANRAGSKVNLRRLSCPYLIQLMEKTGETASLVIEDKGQAVYIDQVESLNSLRTANKVGTRAPLYCTAAGKVLLAFSDSRNRENLLNTIPLKPLTLQTITSRTRQNSEGSREVMSLLITKNR